MNRQTSLPTMINLFPPTDFHGEGESRSRLWLMRPETVLLILRILVGTDFGLPTSTAWRPAPVLVAVRPRYGSS